MRMPNKKAFAKCLVEDDYTIDGVIRVFVLSTQYGSMAKFKLNIPPDGYPDHRFYDKFVSIMDELPKRRINA